MKVNALFLSLFCSLMLIFVCVGMSLPASFFSGNFAYAEGVSSDEESGEEEETPEETLQVLDPNNVIGEDLSVSFVEISADDERFTHIKNGLSNPDKLKVYEVVVQDGDGLQVEQVEGEVTLKIKLDETFDASKINVYRVSSTSSQEPYQFLYADGFVEVQTSEFGIYAISQVSGFKPAAPSGNGSNTIALVLIIVGGLAVIIAVVVSICVGARKKSN